MKRRQAAMLMALTLVAACGRGRSQPAAAAAPAPAPAPARGMPGPNAVPPQSPADPPVRGMPGAPAAMPATRPAGASLYTRLGGVDAIRAVVDDFVGRVAADDRINGFFRGVDITNLKRLLTEQICQATGGPCTYTGRSMRETHTGMNLTDAHFTALVEDLTAALDRFNVPAAEKNELLTALAGMKGDIVGR